MALQLIQTKVNYVVQEAVVVIKDIFRRYPNRYESIIGVLCSSLDTLDEPEAKVIQHVLPFANHCVIQLLAGIYDLDYWRVR